MGFLSGRVTFVRYRVSGESPLPFNEETLEAVSNHAIGRHGGADPTGVLYIEPDKEDFISLLGLVDEPLASLPLERVRPGRAVLDEVMESLR